jgi:hypothetical protein
MLQDGDNLPESPDDGEPADFDIEELAPEAQKQEMRSWFLANYTDPIQNAPFESAEGPYYFLWGGPYDPYEELSAEFGIEVPEDVIRELADELSSIASGWTGNPNEQDVDNYEFDTHSFTEHRESFDVAITNIDLILCMKVELHLLQPLLRLLYANVITALETYLFYFFYAAIQDDNNLFRKFVEMNPDFIKRKMNLSDVFTEYENIDQTVREYLIAISWHNLPRVKPLYEGVLKIKFNDAKMREILTAVAIRHDIVHRNGKNKNGVEMVLTREQIIPLISHVKDFVELIENEWHALEQKG